MKLKQIAAEADSTGRNEDHLTSCADQARNCVNDRVDASVTDGALRVRNGAGAKFDDDTAGSAELFTRLSFGVLAGRCSHHVASRNPANIVRLLPGTAVPIGKNGAGERLANILP